MSEIKKVKLELPDDIVIPSGCELPEVEIISATLRKTVIQDDGKMIEVDETIELPVIETEKK